MIRRVPRSLKSTSQQRSRRINVDDPDSLAWKRRCGDGSRHDGGFCCYCFLGYGCFDSVRIKASVATRARPLSGNIDKELIKVAVELRIVISGGIVFGSEGVGGRMFHSLIAKTVPQGI